MSKLQLPNVTLIAVTSVKVYETVEALKYSMRGIDFGEVVLVSHEKPRFLPEEITFKQCEPITDIDRFNYMMVYEIAPYVSKDYALLVHYDGFVVHPESWRKEFLDYDYIGSPWPIPTDDAASFTDADGNIVRVGNSVSIRSKRILEYPLKHSLEWRPHASGFYNEDAFLCVMNKVQMEKDGLKFATIDVAKYFGREHPLPENRDIDTFVFHKWWGPNEKYPKFESKSAKVKRILADISRPVRNVLGIHKRG